VARAVPETDLTIMRRLDELRLFPLRRLAHVARPAGRCRIGRESVYLLDDRQMVRTVDHLFALRST
jgi:hypothetical protein